MDTETQAILPPKDDSSNKTIMQKLYFVIYKLWASNEIQGSAYLQCSKNKNETAQQWHI